MGANELISVIVPAHNAEKTIGQTIDSIMRQTYTQWEMIVIDDCSADGTMSVIERYASKEERMTILSNERNLGVSETRNRGVKCARGTWVAFLDSDDMWSEEKLERQMRLVQENLHQGEQPDIVFTGSAFINDKGERLEYRLYVPERISYHELLKQNVISCSSVLVRKELLLRYPMRYDNMHEDYAVWLQILRDGGHAYGIDEPLLIYRISEDSKSGNKRRAALMTYRVYRYVGLGRVRSFYYFCWYAFRSLRKYRGIVRAQAGTKP